MPAVRPGRPFTGPGNHDAPAPARGGKSGVSDIRLSTISTGKTLACGFRYESVLRVGSGIIPDSWHPTRCRAARRPLLPEEPQGCRTRLSPESITPCRRVNIPARSRVRTTVARKRHERGTFCSSLQTVVIPGYCHKEKRFEMTRYKLYINISACALILQYRIPNT